VLNIVSEWIEECTANHVDCVTSDTDSLPTRLISISGKVVHLELTETWTTAPHYATLSYCWGNLDFLKTTTSRLEGFFTEIPFDRVPQTFKDAIELAQALNIEYIWIDSLCIVQDSDID
jgi:hypothetical protein